MSDLGGSDLPRLLVVSDYTMATSRAGSLANPTLYNLFERYPPDRLLWLSPLEATLHQPPQAPFDVRTLAYRTTFLPRPPRGKRFVESILAPLDLQLSELGPLPRFDEVRRFDPELVLVASTQAGTLIPGLRLARRLKTKSIAYFLDDWPAIDRRRWLTGGVFTAARALLQETDAWLMISDELRDGMSRRYNVPIKRTLVVHNPVNVDALPTPTFMPRRQGRFRILYAGSVHSMHADSLLTIARAVHILRNEGVDIELVVHTLEWHERAYRKDWERWGVPMGGVIPYAELPTVLRDADLLLVCLAFDPAIAYMAMYSLLTKITDYMATGVPFLVCGPPGCASVNFARRWNCGLICETNTIDRVVELLREQTSRPESNAEMARRAWDVLRAGFSTAVVQSRLYEFLNQVARGDKYAAKARAAHPDSGERE